MPAWLQGRITFANVTSLLALFVALGAGTFAVASIPGKDGKITACYSKKSGALRVIDTAKDNGCEGGEKKISFNRKGPRGFDGQRGAVGPQGIMGQQGEQGKQGDQGVPGTARAYGTVRPQDCALVNTTVRCTAIRAKGVGSITRFFAGVYCIKLPGIDTTAVSSVATVDRNLTASPAGDASVSASPLTAPSAFCPDGPDNILMVETERLVKTNVNQGSGLNNASVEAQASGAEDVGFTFLVP